jgi:excinuclease ABC subunit B
MASHPRLLKSREQVFAQGSVLDIKGYDPSNPYALQQDAQLSSSKAAEEQEDIRLFHKLKKLSVKSKEMEKAARELDFIEAARLRDEMFRLQKELAEMK